MHEILTVSSPDMRTRLDITVLNRDELERYEIPKEGIRHFTNKAWIPDENYPLDIVPGGRKIDQGSTGRPELEIILFETWSFDGRLIRAVVHDPRPEEERRNGPLPESERIRRQYLERLG